MRVLTIRSILITLIIFGLLTFGEIIAKDYPEWILVYISCIVGVIVAFIYKVYEEN